MANTTVNIDIQVQSKSLNELEQELAQINAELKDVPVNSQAFKDLSKEAQGLTSELNKAQQAAEGFTSEEKFRAADGAIKLMGGSLASVVGTLGVLGVESEAFGDFEKKAASAIAVAIGFKDVGEGITQLGPLLGKAGAAVKGFSITTKQALIATGIGAFAVLLGTIVAYWDDITSAVTKFGEKVPFIGKALEGIKAAFDAIIDAARPVLEFLGILPDATERANNAVIESNNKVIQSHEREIAVLEASGAKAEEVYKKKRELLQAELDNLKRTDADKEEIYKKETELQVLEAKEATRIRTEEEKKRTEATKKATEERVKAEEDAAKKVEEANKKLQETLKSLEDNYQQGLNLSRDLFDTRMKQLEVLAETEQDQINIVENYRDKAIEESKIKQEESVKATRKRFAELLKNELLNADQRAILEAELQKELNQIIEIGGRERSTIVKQAEKDIQGIKQETVNKDKANLEEQKRLIQEEFNERREKLNEYKELFTSVFDNIANLSQQRFERELRYLQRERSEVENNVNLTEEQRIAALNNIEAKEREIEIRRIKAERDQFTIRQAILLAEEVMKTKFFVAEQLRINALTATEATAAASSVAIEGAKQTGKAAMSLGSFVATLGPLGIAVFAASIGGIIASIIAARKNAKSQIAALGVPNVGGGGINASSIPSAPSTSQNAQERAPQQLMACPMTKTYVLTGDVTSGQEAEAKLNTKRKVG